MIPLNLEMFWNCYLAGVSLQPERAERERSQWLVYSHGTANTVPRAKSMSV